MAFYGKEVKTRKEQKEVSEKVKLRRRIEDYLRKYASQDTLEKIAVICNIKY